MEIAQLRTLMHVAELGSLSKAADRLNIAQPALSRQVRLLEQELGVRLFDRHGRGMVITEAGREVLKRASRIMAELEEIRAAASDREAPLRGSISIGMPPTVSDIVSVPLVAAFRKAHPDVTVRLVSAYSGYLLDWAQRGDVDVSILYDPRASRTLRSRPLLEESLFLIGPPQADLSPDRALPFRSIQDRRLLLPSRGHGLRDLVERLAAECAIALDVPVEANSFTTLKDLVSLGHGWTILPFAPIHGEIRAGRLSCAPLIDPVPVRRLALAYLSDRPATRLSRFAGKAVEEVVADLVGRGIWAGRLLAAAEPQAPRD
ncbi:MAG TPA: LysR substrate-binding domain-containing protein [Ferrovibrio sp.]|jgi:DNA-binding transcriptional LysR family regulator|uniref:LysR substrate-binding domain-containing protein n=1 Tax=Ferrovibrio sp. TaxID=1917215 RepID=UPI002ED17E24